MCVVMRAGMHHVYKWVQRVDRHIYVCMDLCMDLRIDMWISMRTDVSIYRNVSGRLYRGRTIPPQRSRVRRRPVVVRADMTA